jgi:hypothetical protein
MRKNMTVKCPGQEGGERGKVPDNAARSPAGLLVRITIFTRPNERRIREKSSNNSRSGLVDFILNGPRYRSRLGFPGPCFLLPCGTPPPPPVLLLLRLLLLLLKLRLFSRPFFGGGAGGAGGRRAAFMGLYR